MLKERLSKNEYISRRIDELIAEVYQNEIARDYILLKEESERSDEQKKSVNAANANIESLQKQIKWLEANIK